VERANVVAENVGGEQVDPTASENLATHGFAAERSEAKNRLSQVTLIASMQGNRLRHQSLLRPTP
jgi:hypothetical protein